MTTQQTTEQRELAHIESTKELLREVLDAQNIPYEIYGVAIYSLINEYNFKRSKNIQEYMNAMELFIGLFDQSVPLFTNDKLQEALSKVNDRRENITKLLSLISVGPADIKIQDGKVVL